MWPGLGLRPGRPGEKPASNRLVHGTVSIIIIIIIIIINLTYFQFQAKERFSLECPVL